jgi:lipoprotein-anchoring transpeptidase ErfK/SrfK
MQRFVGGSHAGWVLRAPILQRFMVVALAAGIWSGTAVAAAPVPPTQALVTLLAAHAVHPAPNAPATASIAGTRPLTAVQTVLPLLGRAEGGWLHVRLAGRPNSGTGWIRAQATRLGTTPWHVIVDTSQRRVRVFHGGVLVRSFGAVVGKPSTPTPAGTFFVEEAVRLSPGDVGAPFALALSARSNVFQEFEGGPGQVALHGVANVGGTLGTAASHGCIRLDDAAIRWLAGHIGAGVPVTITT